MPSLKHPAPAGEDVSSSDDDSVYFDSLSDQSMSTADEHVVDLTEGKSNDPDEITSKSSQHRSPPGLLRPRAYQLEMLDEGLRRNIIVAMDTGSGKTLIAVLRIAAELERCATEQLVWVSCPTVELCDQQFSVFSTQLPAFQCRILKGSDNVNHWTDQHLWDTVLKNARVVVSTPAILLDALTHAYIRLDRISLLVFDEAHNCIKRNPANVIMQDFYLPSLSRNPAAAVPSILGLTASPILNAKAGGLDALEKNLNAIARTPRLNREEFMQFVHPPLFETLLYQPTAPDDWNTRGTPTLKRLLQLYQDLDIREDPYVLSLKSSTNPNHQRNLNKALLGRKTYCQLQMKRFCSQGRVILDQLGPYAADYYIHTCIRRFLKTEDPILGGWVELSTDEKKYLIKVLQQLQFDEESLEFGDRGPLLSSKAELLIELLVRESIPDFAGLVFVEQRATVAVLAHIISIHPRTKHLYKCSTFVGTSNENRTSNIADIVELKHQKDTLEDLRSGRKNLIITTNVLEEGIDVSACHIVVSFDRPANLKSFIQRRGRARKAQSKFVLMLSQQDTTTSIEEWSQLEAGMKKKYEDHMRELEAVKRREATPEDTARTFLVEATGALLTMENAVAHLYHFCNRLRASPYAHLHPEFVFEEDSTNGLISARVSLPIAVDYSVRQASGLASWITEKNAKKDAAFEAYKALYQAGLINDHLLPLLRHDEGQEAMREITRGPALVKVAERFNPWISVAEQWKTPGELYSATVTLQTEDHPPIRLFMLLPRRHPPLPTIILYWNQETTYKITTDPPNKISMRRCSLPQVSETTYVLLSTVFRSRTRYGQHDFAALFTPKLESDALKHWQTSVEGTHSASDLTPAVGDVAGVGLIRDRTRYGLAHLLRRVTAARPTSVNASLDPHEADNQHDSYLEVSRLPKQTDFLHRYMRSEGFTPSHSKVTILPADTCEVDNLPLPYALFALFIPSITHRFETMMVAQELCRTILQPVDFGDVSLVLTAISASSAREGTNYERLELLGDCILKLYTSVQLIAEHPNWHEGYLSAKKDHTVANSRLARAALETGLGKFILTKAFTGQKWRPSYNSDLLKEKQTSEREISTKTLADVVEALVGAALIDGGMSKALACLKLFLPEINWQPLSTRLTSLYDIIPISIPLPSRFNILETLIGHHFSRPILLIEAMTHPSFTGSTNLVYSSYQRLEFLGDAVLDDLIVSFIFSQAQREYSHVEMYWLRAALVNSDFLAFLAMEWCINEARGEVSQDKQTGTFQEINTRVNVHFWKFMRHSCMVLAAAQKECVARFDEIAPEIRQTLLGGSTYPWAQLARLKADKYFSDIVESVLGAVYLDTKAQMDDTGNNSAVNVVAERIGILPYLKRILSEDVQLEHPKGILGKLAGTEKVKYVVSFEEEHMQGEGEDGEGEGRKLFTCAVSVGERQIVKVGGAWNDNEAKTRAAERAVEILREEQRGERMDERMDIDTPSTTSSKM